MAETVQVKYGTQNQAITITLTSLANAAQRQSTVIDNTSNLYEDAFVMVIAKTGSSSTTSTGRLYVYAYGTSDGTHYTDGASGTDGSITLTSPPNMPLIGVLNAVANSTTYNGGPFSVAQAFGGTLPEKWGIVVDNECGSTLDGTTASANYQGINRQITP